MARGNVVKYDIIPTMRRGMEHESPPILPDRALELLTEILGPNDSWKKYAACASQGDVFFGQDKGGKEKQEREAQAIRICEGCPVARECGEWAIAQGQRFGVWGGMREEQIRPKITPRPRGHHGRLRR